MTGRLWLIVLGGLFVTNSLLYAADEVNLTDRANRVKQMTAEERTRLQKNLERFEKFTPEEKDAYRQLSTTVESDPALKQLMSTYTTWLQTLTPGQREELRLEQDVNKRRDLVEKFRKEQLEQEELPLPEPEPGRRMIRPPTVSKDELFAVLKVIESAIPEPRKQFLPEAQDEIGQLERANGISQLLLWGSPDGWQITLPAEQLLKEVSAPEVRAFVTPTENRTSSLSVPGRFSPERFERVTWSGVIAMTVRENVDKELQKRIPREDVLIKYFAGLDSSKRFELNQLPGDDWRQEVIRLYFQDHPDEDVERLFRLRRPRFGDRGNGPDNRGPGPGFRPRSGEGNGPPRPGERLRNLLENGPPAGGPRQPAEPQGADR